jgi:ABC-2 type transport system permease protein
LIRRILILVRKDFWIFMGDPVAIGLGFIVPMVMILVFGLVFGNTGHGSTSEFVVLAVNEDRGPAGKRLLSALDDLSEIRIVERLKGDSLALDSSKARERVEKGRNSVAIIVPADFSDGLKAGKIRLSLLEDPSDPVTAGVVTGLLQKQAFSTFPALMPMNLSQMGMGRPDSTQWKGFNQDIRRSVKERFGVPIPDSLLGSNLFPDEMVLGSDKDSATAASSGFNFGESFEKIFQIKREEVVGKQIVNPGIAQSVAGPAVMFLLFAAGAVAASLLREMHGGAVQRLLVSRASAGELLFSKYFYAIVLGNAQLITMMVYGWLIFGLDIFTHPLEIFVVILCTAAAMSSLGLFIAAIARTEEQAAGLQVVVILGISAIGGAMFPSFMIPKAVRTLAQATPVHWAMQGFLDVFWRDQSLPGILFECAILLAMAVVLVSIATVLFRKRLAVELG